MNSHSKSPSASRDETGPEANPLVLLFLLCVAHFALISALFLLVFHQVSAGFAEPGRSYWLAEYPVTWDVAFHTWQALSAPTVFLDHFMAASNVAFHTWRDAPRVLLQCAFCGVVWGFVTFLLYWIIRSAVGGVQAIKALPIERRHGSLTNPAAQKVPTVSA